ncbi:hypothetical protein ALC62_03753 [Cyphomyrmex costatus]|uniref:Nuclease HARBI1 n=1 Tax=Cyphomyrmex costatus TaxID=456900 RepID=A0A151IL25_9HYME|nr:hypothetical protein ALC62_03753 [Cyphomyrmex costatus]
MDPDNFEIVEIQDINSSSEEGEIQIRALKKYIRDGQNPFEFFNEREFKKRFRFSKNSVMFGILPLIEEGFAKIYNRGLPISPVIQLLICLRFYATASFQVRICLIFFSQSTISRIIFRVSILIASHINRYIRMPISEEARTENKRLYDERYQL